MAEWVYKLTRPRATYADTHALAVSDHFLCMPAFTHGIPPERVREVENVAQVAVGDVIHYYYRTPSGLIRCFGSFGVGDGSAFPGLFSPWVGYGALVRIVETPNNRLMLGRLRRSHSPDPKLGAFTGWVLEKLPLDCGTPGFNQAIMFPTRTTNLWRYPDASLPRVKCA